MEHLLSVWPKILEQTQKARHILFLSDFDGTLAPIVERPEMALLSNEIRLALQSLARQSHITMGIISGRALTDLKEKVKIEGIIYAGNHGFEIEGPGLFFINPITEEIKPFFRIVKQVLTLTLNSIKGVFIEDKGLTLSVHYRQVKEEETETVKDTVEKVIKGSAISKLFKITSGKKVYEVRPSINWDKGKAIRLLMKRYGKGGRQSGLLPIYLGDDLTDEDGFRVIEKYGKGISVHIGEVNSCSIASYYLKSPDEVGQFLHKLSGYAERGQLCELFSTI
jgi:trehalose 6-phosphate phosphatase